MTKHLTILLALFLAGCATSFTRPDQRLQWLATQQASDGSWGQDEKTRVLLTSLACVAYVSAGIRPQDTQFGPVFEKGLLNLLNAEGEGPAAGEPILDSTSALAWAMNEVYARTRLTSVGEHANKLREHVLRQSNKPTPFDLWAIGGLWTISYPSTNQSAYALHEMKAAFLSAESNLLNQACVALATHRLDRSELWWVPYDEEMDKLVLLGPRKWRSAEYPMLTLVSLADVFLESGGYGRLWVGPFWEEIIEAEKRQGYWSATDLGVATSREMKLFSNEEDRTIYTTCMALVAIHQAFSYGRCRHPHIRSENTPGISNK